MAIVRNMWTRLNNVWLSTTNLGGQDGLTLPTCWIFIDLVLRYS